MRKNKILKRGIVAMVIFSLAISMMPAMSLSVATASDESTGDGSETSADNQMLHFVMKVRWGNVIGEPTNSDGADFSGLISVSDKARVSLERTLLFEKHIAIGRHDKDTDKITKHYDNNTVVSWNSLICGHWDGVKVLVSSPANDVVTISIPEQGSVEMSAQDLYDLSEPKVVDVGENREIVIKTYPIKEPKYFLKVLWGKTSRSAYEVRSEEAGEVEISAEGTGSNSDSSVVIASGIFKRITNGIAWHNASGNFQINSGGTLNFIRALRFEGKDKVLPSSSANKIEWNSYVAQGVDGILVKLNLDADSLDNSDTVTLNFTKAGWSQNFSIVDLYHDKITEATVEGDYGVIIQVWRRPNKSLIRVRNNPTVYVVEDGVRRPIPSPEVLYSMGLNFDKVEVVEESEADTYATGEAACYADGAIVKEDDINKPKVYVIANGERRHIESKEAFEELGYDWNSIVKVKPGVLGLYRLGTAMKSSSVHPEGALIREDGTDTVYLIEGGKKKPISSLNIFNARRLDWNKVLVVKKAQMNKFQVGANLQYPDGALVKDSAGKVYKIDQGKKRWIRSRNDFYGAGYKDEDIITVTDVSEINNLAATAESSDIVADDI